MEKLKQAFANEDIDQLTDFLREHIEASDIEGEKWEWQNEVANLLSSVISDTFDWDNTGNKNPNDTKIGEFTQMALPIKGELNGNIAARVSTDGVMLIYDGLSNSKFKIEAKKTYKIVVFETT